MHLRSSLLKVKPIAALTETAEELRAQIPKTELAAEDKAAFNNLSSALCNHNPVKQATTKAIKAISEVLNVPDQGKGKKTKKARDDDEDGQPIPKARKKDVEEDAAMLDVEEDDEEESEFEGFESDVDEPGPAVGEPDSEAEAAEEAEFSKFDELLGSSDDEDDEEATEKLYSRFKGREQVNLDDISVSGSGSESDVEDLSESSGSASPPPAKKVKEAKSSSKTKKVKKIEPVRDSTFLPSLMGGYISGSESASDIDVAPAKKRLGQRSRQAIWEKKFGAKANHIRKEKQNGGRDDGWDMRRGAVGGDDQGRRGPWKKGITNPMAHGRSNQPPRPQQPAKETKPTKRDDEGPLHPSWQAAKKAKEQKAAQFSGQKIVFD